MSEEKNPYFGCENPCVYTLKTLAKEINKEFPEFKACIYKKNQIIFKGIATIQERDKFLERYPNFEKITDFEKVKDISKKYYTYIIYNLAVVFRIDDCLLPNRKSSHTGKAVEGAVIQVFLEAGVLLNANRNSKTNLLNLSKLSKTEPEKMASIKKALSVLPSLFPSLTSQTMTALSDNSGKVGDLDFDDTERTSLSSKYNSKELRGFRNGNDLTDFCKFFGESWTPSEIFKERLAIIYSQHSFDEGQNYLLVDLLCKLLMNEYRDLLEKNKFPIDHLNNFFLGHQFSHHIVKLSEYRHKHEVALTVIPFGYSKIKSIQKIEAKYRDERYYKNKNLGNIKNIGELITGLKIIFININGKKAEITVRLKCDGNKSQFKTTIEEYKEIESKDEEITDGQ